MKIRKIFFFVFIACVSCREQQVRRPVTSGGTYTLGITSVFQKEMNRVEERKIERFIEKDSLHQYISSPNGFWYRYVKKIDSESITPKKGDVVRLTYDILDLNNEVLYSKIQNGIKEYRVDKEDFITALQTGIKLMKAGETVQFVIPPYNAFGVIGDGNKIGINTSIISTVTLIDIK